MISKYYIASVFFICILFSSIPNSNAQGGEKSDSSLTYLALGDSYTIGESVETDQQWPRQLRLALDSLGVEVNEPEIIAKTGWRTDEMLSAAKKQVGKNEYDLVSLLIGVNNEYQGRSPKSFIDEFEQCLEFAINHCNSGADGVFVLSIPDYGFTPFGAEKQKQITKRLNAYNKICREICKKHDVLFINITDISREVPDDKALVAEDGLHPSGKQYAKWVDRAAEKVKGLIKD